MPPWGRPPGGRLGRKSQRGWGGLQAWNERRFEEIEDSDDDDEQGVQLDLGIWQKRHVSDELRFTGMDLSSSRARRRRGNAYSEDSDDSEEDDDDEAYDGPGQHRQIMLREKEDLLVERALERIRRARMMGKTNVKLSQAEVDALERAERIQKQPDPPRTVKGKKAAIRRPKVEERRRSKSDKPSDGTPPLKAIEPRRKSKSSAWEDPQPPYPMSATDFGQPGGAMVYSPPGYYTAPAPRPRSSGSKSGSRTASSQSLRQPQQHTPPLPQYQHPYHAGRYFSNPDTAYPGRPPSNSSLRSDPSDPNWEPRARSATNLVPYHVDQPPYPVYQPPPSQFDPRDPRFAVPPGPQIASGPPDMYPVPQMPGYRYPQDEMFLYSPNTPSRGTMTGEDDDEEEDDDDYDQGVEIDVVEQSGGSYGIQTRSGAAAAAGNRGRGGGAMAKRGRRGK